MGVNMKNPLEKVNFKKKNIWLVTGAAGFIGSNLVNFLLKKNQKVIGIDNFINSKKKNLTIIKSNNLKKINNFIFIKKDLLKLNFNHRVFNKLDYVVHLAALGSVPRSFENTLNSSRNNLDIYIHLLNFLKKRKIKKLIVTSSSSIYGDSKLKKKSETLKYNALSPYAVSKVAVELYSKIFSKNFHIPITVFRIFNVFGPFQRTDSVYSAVIPKWIKKFLQNKKIEIFGNKKISRDYTYVDNILFAIYLATISKKKFELLNIACGRSISLVKVIKQININFNEHFLYKNPVISILKKRNGDIKKSLADISKATKILKYYPIVGFEDGIKRTVKWIVDHKW
jgi:UDP-N-acetylglucosamine 4-epimerase